VDSGTRNTTVHSTVIFHHPGSKFQVYVAIAYQPVRITELKLRTVRKVRSRGAKKKKKKKESA